MPKKARAAETKKLAVSRSTGATATIRPGPKLAVEAAREFAVEIARVAHEDQCEDILVLDLRGISPVCDFFVIATGTSDRQMRAVVDHIEVTGKPRGEKPYGVAGYEEGTWIVVDYVDVVVHLFDPERRLYYDLESLWGDCPRVKWER